MDNTRIIALQAFNRAFIDVLHETRLDVELRIWALVGTAKVMGGESDLCGVGGAGEGIDHDIEIGIGTAVWCSSGSGVTSRAHGRSEERRESGEVAYKDTRGW